MKPLSAVFVLFLLAGFAVPMPSRGQMLKYVSTLKSPALDGVVSADISRDGRFLYAASYVAKTATVYRRDATTGLLTEVQALNEAQIMDGMTAIRLSPDNKFAVSAAFRVDAAGLYTRDAKSGKLKRVDAVEHGRGTKALLDWAIDVVWSPDSKFVYVIAPNSAAVNVFKITDKPGLEFVQVEQGTDRCFDGARGAAASSDGRFLYVASERAGTLTVLERDVNTGKLSVLEIIKNGTTKAEGLDGAFSVAVSSDNQFVYVSSGRFRGSDAISIFKRKKDGTLDFVDELYNFTDKLERFVGGNEVTISPDGNHAYAVASRSDSMVVFKRDKKTGKLQQTQFLVDQLQGVGAMAMPGGLTGSPDGRFVYVAAEGSDALAIFKIPGPPAPAIAEKPKSNSRSPQ